MSREDEPMVRVHLWIFARDQERIKQYFDNTLGFSRAARLMIRKFLDNLEADTLAKAKRPSAMSVDETREILGEAGDE